MSDLQSEQAGVVDPSSDITKRFWGACDRREQELQALGDQVRKDIVIPVCQKYDLSYTSSHLSESLYSSPFSSRRDGFHIICRCISGDALEDRIFPVGAWDPAAFVEIKRDLVPVLKALSVHDSRAGFLFAYVRDYKLGDKV